MTRRLDHLRVALAVVSLGAAFFVSACGDSSDQGPLSTAVAGAGILNAGPGDLAGTWIVDRAASDPPPAGHRGGRGPQGMDGGARGGRGGPGDVGGRGGPGGPGGHGGPGGLGGPGGPHGAPSDTLTITETDTTIALSHGTGPERVIYPDGRTITREGPHGGTVTITASWVDGALVVMHSHGDRTHTQTFTLSDDGHVLTVTASGQGPEGTMSHKVVYNRG